MRSLPSGSRTWVATRPWSEHQRPAAFGAVSQVVELGARHLEEEDHADTLDAMSKPLSRCGHTVFLARDSASALAHARRARPDVLIADIALGEGDHRGIEEMRELYPVPAIALTGLGMPQDVQRVVSAGFNAPAQAGHAERSADDD